MSASTENPTDPAEKAPTTPSRWRDFVALMKLRLNLMVLVATWTGWYLGFGGQAEGALMDLLALLLFVLLAAAGASAINQGIEADLDARMRRTKNRPVAAGRVSVVQALLFGIVLSAAGAIGVFAVSNAAAAILTAATVILYVGAYTPLKTRTTLNTIVGAIPGAVPPVIGWAAARGEVGPVGGVLFAILFLWQFPHFYAIASMYREDYREGGYLMLPVVDETGRRTAFEIMLTAAVFVPSCIGLWWLGAAGEIYLTGAVLVSLWYLHASWRTIRAEGEARWRGLLRSSLLVLPVLYVLMAIDRQPVL